MQVAELGQQLDLLQILEEVQFDREPEVHIFIVYRADVPAGCEKHPWGLAKLHVPYFLVRFKLVVLHDAHFRVCDLDGEDVDQPLFAHSHADVLLDVQHLQELCVLGRETVNLFKVGSRRVILGDLRDLLLDLRVLRLDARSVVSEVQALQQLEPLLFGHLLGCGEGGHLLVEVEVFSVIVFGRHRTLVWLLRVVLGSRNSKLQVGVDLQIFDFEGLR